MSTLDKALVWVAVVVFGAMLFMASLYAQKVCVSYVAPWVLDTDDKLAATIWCKPTGGAR